ncbi:replication Fork Protection Component Swi3 [Cooperia oncophora]
MDDEFDEINDFFGNDLSDNEPDEDGAEPTSDQVLNNLLEKENQEVVKKRAKARPQPKLNEATLTGPKGVPALLESFKSFKPNTKKDPYENLAVMMKKYQHWAHVMFPKLKFEDVISKCEALGDKRAIKVYMMKSRLGMPLTDEDFAPIRRQKGDDAKPHEGRHAEKSSSTSATTPLAHGDTPNDAEIDLMESAELARRKAMEEEQRRREEEELALADEIMDDFDMY